MKRLIEIYIQKTKNPNFHFDPNVTSSVLLKFTFNMLINYIRGWIKFPNLKRRSKFLFVGKGVEFFNKKKIIFGNNVILGNYVKLSALGKGNIEIGNNVNIGAFTQIIISTSFNNIGDFIKIEDNVGIGEFSYIGGGGGVIIGKNTIIGQYFSVHPENHNYSDTKKLIREQGISRKGIRIGENCWIGSKVTILDGVTIGDGCVIAAGAVVTKSFGPNLVIGGVPAKVIKKRGK